MCSFAFSLRHVLFSLFDALFFSLFLSIQTCLLLLDGFLLSGYALLIGFIHVLRFPFSAFRFLRFLLHGLVVGQRAKRGVVEDSIFILQADSPVLHRVVDIVESVDNRSVRAFHRLLCAVAILVVLVGACLVERAAMRDLLNEETTIVVGVFHRRAVVARSGIFDILFRDQQSGGIVAVFADLGRHAIDVKILGTKHLALFREFLPTLEVERVVVRERRRLQVCLAEVRSLVVLGFGIDVDVRHVARIVGHDLAAFACKRCQQAVRSVCACRRASVFALIGVGHREHSSSRVECDYATFLLTQNVAQVFHKPLAFRPILAEIVFTEQYVLVDRSNRTAETHLRAVHTQINNILRLHRAHDTRRYK